MKETGSTAFDAILEESGSYGRFQKWRIWLIIFPASFYASLQGNVLVFQTTVPDYWCHVPGRELTNYTLDQWKNLTLPPSKDDPGSPEKCLQYNVTFEGDQVVVGDTQLSCQAGWQHDNSSLTHTVATYFEWLCAKERYSSDIFAVNAIGNAVGTFSFPIIADRLVGRRIMFFVAIGFSVVFNLFILVTSNYYLHLTCRFLAGMAFEGNWSLAYTNMLELVKPEKRSTLCFYLFASWSIAMMLLPLLAWAMPHWVLLTSIINFSGLYFFFLWRFLPESPRWLVSRDKYDEAAVVLQQVARSNGKEVPSTEVLVKKLKSVKSDQKDGPNFFQVFRYRRITLYLIATAIQAFCYYLIYACTLLSFDILKDRIFLGFFIASVIQAPSGFIGWLSAHYLGRRASAHGLCALLALSCLVGTLSSDKWLLFGISSLIKCFVNAAIFIFFMYLYEAFPTPIRASAFGCVIVFGFFGYACAPYVNAAGMSIQFWVLLALSSLALLCSLPLPETMGFPLPQTFEEAEDMVKYRPLTSWVHYWNYTRYLPETADQDTKKETK